MNPPTTGQQSASRGGYTVAVRRVRSAVRKTGRKLDLSRLDLDRLPPELWKLSELEDLSLAYNKLSSLPDDINQLSMLKTLDLTGNNLTELPSTIVDLSNLTLLFAGYNKLASVPTEIKKLKSLYGVILDQNELTHLDPSVGELSSLRHLYLEHNRLTELPAELGRLESLNFLGLLGNPLPAPYSQWLGSNATETARNVLAYLRGEAIPPDLDSEERALASTAEQRPAAYRFGLRNERVDTVSEGAQPRDSDFALDTYTEAKAKTRALHDRLIRSNSTPRVVGSAERIMDALGITLTDVRPGLLLSRVRSLEADRAAFDSEEGRAELFPDALAMVDDAVLSLRDLLAAFPVIREIEIERVALDLDRIPENIPAIWGHTRNYGSSCRIWRRLGSGYHRIGPNRSGHRGCR